MIYFKNLHYLYNFFYHIYLLIKTNYSLKDIGFVSTNIFKILNFYSFFYYIIKDIYNENYALTYMT